MQKNKKPLVSIVIPSYNSEKLINSCLKSLLATAYSNFEVIFVDDCSTDKSYKIAKEFGKRDKRLFIIRNKKNSGPSVTRNNGIKNAKGDYIAFYETDMESDPKWLTMLVNEMLKNPKLGGIQSKVIDLMNRTVINAVGVKYIPHVFGVISVGFGQPIKNINKPDYVGMGAVGTIFRKDALDAIGFYDEKLVHNIDDIDLGFRMWVAGYKTKNLPQSITYHWNLKPESIRKKTTSSLKSEFYSNKIPRVMLKNYEMKNIFHYLPYFYAVSIIRSIKNILSGNFNPLIGLVMATIWNILVFPNTLSERERIQKLRKISDKEIFNKIGVSGNIWSVYRNQVKPMLNVKTTEYLQVS